MRKLKQYAMYRGKQFIFQGTVKELSKRNQTSEEYIRSIITSTRTMRPSKYRIAIYEIKT